MSRSAAADKGMSAADRTAWDHRHRASKIIGTDVRNPNGDKIGDIKDLIIDEEGNTTLAIVSTGGFLGIGDNLHAIPWSSLKMATTDQGKADKGDRILNMTKDQLKAVPGFESEHWPNFSDRSWIEKNRDYFSGHNAPASHSGATKNGTMGSTTGAAGTTGTGSTSGAATNK
jgi:sporulation protein YlmC with PRC-barrel domain